MCGYIFCSSIGTKYHAPELNPLVFCKLSQCHYIRHRIVFHAKCKGTVMICRKQVDDAPILSSQYFRVPTCSDTCTKSTGAKIL